MASLAQKDAPPPPAPGTGAGGIKLTVRTSERRQRGNIQRADEATEDMETVGPTPATHGNTDGTTEEEANAQTKKDGAKGVTIKFTNGPPPAYDLGASLTSMHPPCTCGLEDGFISRALSKGTGTGRCPWHLVNALCVLLLL